MNHIFWALLILFAIAALMRMDWAYYLVYVVGGVWAFSHWWVRRTLQRLRVKRRIPQYAFTNEVVTAAIEIENRSWLPLPWLQVQEAVPLDLKDQPDYRVVLSIGGRSALRHTYRLYCRRRGYYTVGPLNLRTSDLFGFVDARWQEAGGDELIVYPAIVPLEKLGLPGRMPFGALPTRRQLDEDPARLGGVRQYVSGDSLRRIHWKATAHEDTLLVKKLQPSQELPVFIALNLDRSAYPARALIGASEWAISIAASIAGHMSEQRQAVGLASNGVDPFIEGPAAPIGLRVGRSHLMNVWRLLARIQLNDEAPPLHEWLPLQTASLPWGTTVVLIAPGVDEKDLWMLHRLHRRGSNVVVLVCAGQRDFRSIQANGRRLGLRILPALWESDLQAVEQRLKQFE
ncbi:MAG: DUF58 domain-containing protein [Caldilinea sp.]|uniref:DUF58 domain-containing protein n=1 Tax=Caldilinea sp. TaxID=2293560 RepID=UPI003099F7A5